MMLWEWSRRTFMSSEDPVWQASIKFIAGVSLALSLVTPLAMGQHVARTDSYARNTTDRIEDPSGTAIGRSQMGTAGAGQIQKNHSFTINTLTAVAGVASATFEGQATAAGALGLLMTAQIFNATGTTLLYSGDTHTYTAVSETHTFTVNYPAGSFAPGDTILISVSDIPGSIDGAEGAAEFIVVEYVFTGTVLFSTDFESGLDGIVIDNSAGSGNGQWHLTTVCQSTVPADHSAPTSLYFGQDATCHYDTGTAVGGAATSPVITVPTADLALLRFNYLIRTENLGGFDIAAVSVSVNGGVFETAASNQFSGMPLLESGVWQAATVSLTSLLNAKSVQGGEIRVRFTFDSVDSSFNTFDGFYVDDVEVVLGNPALGFTSDPITIAVANEGYTYHVAASPVQPGDTLRFTALTLPHWLRLTDNGDGTAIVSGTPSIFAGGLNPVELEVEDKNSNSATQSFVIQVNTIPNPFGNFGFESSDFTSWTATDIGVPFISMNVSGGGSGPGFGLFMSDPPEGDFAAVHGFDGGGPGVIRLEQQVTLPQGATTLAFDYRGGWDLQNFGATLDRTFYVTIDDGSKAVVQTDLVLTALAGTFVPDTGNLTGVLDVSAYAGQTITIAFNWDIPQDFSGPGFFQLDDVQITGNVNLPATNPLASALLLLALFAAGVVYAARPAQPKRPWRVFEKRGTGASHPWASNARSTALHGQDAQATCGASTDPDSTSTL